jgi:hypothetical protein
MNTEDAVIPAAQVKERLTPGELRLLRQAFEASVVAERVSKKIPVSCNHAMLSTVSMQMKLCEPSFNPQLFGFSSFRQLCEAAAPYFEVALIDKNKPTTLFLRKKQSFLLLVIRD